MKLYGMNELKTEVEKVRGIVKLMNPSVQNPSLERIFYPNWILRGVHVDDHKNVLNYINEELGKPRFSLSPNLVIYQDVPFYEQEIEGMFDEIDFEAKYTNSFDGVVGLNIETFLNGANGTCEIHALKKGLIKLSQTAMIVFFIPDRTSSLLDKTLKVIVESVPRICTITISSYSFAEQMVMVKNGLKNLGIAEAEGFNKIISDCITDTPIDSVSSADAVAKNLIEQIVMYSLRQQ